MDKSRLISQREKNPDAEIEMPEVLGCGHIIEYLFALGITTATGFGMAVIPYTEIYAWAKLVQHEISIYEVETIRSLSSLYIGEHQKAQEALCPPPYTPPGNATPEQRKQVDSFFRNLTRKKDAS